MLPLKKMSTWKLHCRVSTLRTYASLQLCKLAQQSRICAHLCKPSGMQTGAGSCNGAHLCKPSAMQSVVAQSCLYAPMHTFSYANWRSRVIPLQTSTCISWRSKVITFQVQKQLLTVSNRRNHGEGNACKGIYLSLPACDCGTLMHMQILCGCTKRIVHVQREVTRLRTVQHRDQVNTIGDATSQTGRFVPM
jgi:hypothetical protein